MQQNEIEYLLENPELESNLWDQLIEVETKINMILQNKDKVRDKFIYSLQTGVSADQIKVQTSNVSDLSTTLQAANEMTKQYHKELSIRHSKIISQIDACRRIYLIKGILKPTDKKLIELKYEQNLTWEAIELELGKHRTTLYSNLQAIVDLITKYFNSNITNEQLARTQTIQTITKKGSNLKSDIIPGQKTFEVS